jgi:predicted nucleotidyltransferase
MVPRQEIQKLADDVACRFPVEKVILFGSYAYGTPREYSDVDLLVVMEFEGSSFRKSLEIYNALDPAFSCDILVIRPAELTKRYNEFNPLVGDAVDKGVVVYDRRSAEVA